MCYRTTKTWRTQLGRGVRAPEEAHCVHGSLADDVRQETQL